MNSQLFIENYELDISQDISSLLTFEIDSVRNDIGTRSTTWSKTIVLPGTARNNKLFGHIFQIGQSNAYNAALPNVNYNFNAAKSADCILFQNQLQTFRGVLRLMQINIIKGQIEYEVGLFGELASLNLALSGHFLNELDFSAYDTAWTTTNIIASWDGAPGSGVFFPLIDYGQVTVDYIGYDIRAFRPALYVKEYLDKIFTQHNFRYSSDLFETTRFKRLIIPHNQKELTSIADMLLDVSRSSIAEYHADTNISLNVTTASGPFTISAGNSIFTYGGSTPVTGLTTVKVVGQYYSTTDSVWIDLKRNGLMVMTRQLGSTGGTTYTDFQVDMVLGGMIVSPTDTLSVSVRSTSAAWSLEAQSGTRLTFRSDQPLVTILSPGGTITMNSCIPKNVRQIDFLTSIVKMFNLYVWEDKFDSRLIYFKPYVDFYSTSPIDAVDWSYKINRDKAIKIKPMSELTAKTYTFKFKQDDDYWNRLYRERYRDGYGDHVYDSQYEFAEANQIVELTFSATPLVGRQNRDKVVSSIYKVNAGIEERIDSNIRILQSKKITDVTEYKIYDGVDNTPGNTLTTVTNYGYAGHFDDPDAPSNDINFGITRELFFALVSGNPSRTQFNVYWSSYMAEITDKDSKLLNARFYLTPKDIIALDFSKKVMIDGVLYRLNSIQDYNASVVSDCAADLLKIQYLLY